MVWQCRITDVPLRKDHSFRCRICRNRNHCARRDPSDLGRALFFQHHILRDIHSRSIFLNRHTHKSTVFFPQSILFAPMCVNRHIFRNFLVEIKRYAAIFLRIPTIKLVTFRLRISGLANLFSILHHFRHHFAGFLCLIAVVKAHSVGAIKVLRVNQQGIFICKIIFLCKFIPLFLGSRIMQFH